MIQHSQEEVPSNLIHADDIWVSNKFHGRNFTFNLQKGMNKVLLQHQCGLQKCQSTKMHYVFIFYQDTLLRMSNAFQRAKNTCISIL